MLAMHSSKSSTIKKIGGMMNSIDIQNNLSIVNNYKPVPE